MNKQKYDGIIGTMFIFLLLFIAGLTVAIKLDTGEPVVEPLVQAGENDR